MSKDKKKAKQNKSAHPFDNWPPPKKDLEEFIDLPKNKSYRDPEEFLMSGEEPVYEVDDKTKEMIEQEERDDDKEEKDDDDDHRGAR